MNYVTVVFNLPSKSEFRFTVNPNPGLIFEYPLSVHH